MSFQFLSMLGSFWDGIMPAMQEVLVSIVFGYVLYYAFIGISLIITFAQKLFYMMAGIDSINIDNETYGGEGHDDLIVGILRNSEVQDAFWTILGVCLVLLVVFTIIAVIKTEFSMKFVSKAPIISRALTSLANFFIIPVMFIVGIYATSALVRVVNDAVSKENNESLSVKCFKVGSSGANRASNDVVFANYLISGEWLINDERNPFSGCTLGDCAKVAAIIDDMFTGDSTNTNVVKLLGTYDEETESYKDAAKIEEHTYTEKSNMDEGTYAEWQTTLMGYPDFSEGLSYLNIDQVNYFYDFSSFNYILALGSAVVIGWSMLTVCLMLIKRILEMLILFLLSPVMTAVAPLDNGNAEKKLRGEFLKRLLSVIGPVFAFNIFFIIIGILGSLSPFSGSTDILGIVMNKVVLGVFNLMFQIAIIIVGIGLMKTANTMFTSMLGMEDMLGAADANAKKTIGTAGKVALGATAGFGLAFKGTAALLKGGVKGVAGVGKGVGSAGKLALRGASRLTGYKGQVKNDEELEAEERILARASKEGDSEGVEISTQNIEKIKSKIAKVPKKRREDYKIWTSKQKIKDIKGNTGGTLEESKINDELISNENDKILGVKQGRSNERAERKEQRKEKFDASAVGKKLQDLKQGKFLLKDIFGANSGAIFGRLTESLGGLSGESGQSAMNLLFNKNERKSFYKSKEEIASDKEKADQSKKENITGKGAQIDFLKKSVAKDKGAVVEAEYKKLNENLENANKDGVLSEQFAAKKNLESFETKHGITKQAEIMQASINNVSDKDHFNNMDKLNTLLAGARTEAEAKGIKENEDEAKKLKEANKDAFKDSLKDTNDLLKQSIKAQKRENVGVDQKEYETAQTLKMEELIRSINGGFASLGEILKGSKRTKGSKGSKGSENTIDGNYEV